MICVQCGCTRPSPAAAARLCPTAACGSADQRFQSQPRPSGVLPHATWPGPASSRPQAAIPARPTHAAATTVGSAATAECSAGGWSPGVTQHCHLQSIVRQAYVLQILEKPSLGGPTSMNILFEDLKSLAHSVSRAQKIPHMSDQSLWVFSCWMFSCWTNHCITTYINID